MPENENEIIEFVSPRPNEIDEENLPYDSGFKSGRITQRYEEEKEEPPKNAKYTKFHDEQESDPAQLSSRRSNTARNMGKFNLI